MLHLSIKNGRVHFILYSVCTIFASLNKNTLVMETENLSKDYRPLILVAEDDDSNFKLIKAIIGKKCEILWAKNGEEMVNLFKENRGKTDAILMDIKMPIMNGLEATKIIREEEKELPIIMQTAYAFTADRENEWLPVLRKYW